MLIDNNIEVPSTVPSGTLNLGEAFLLFDHLAERDLMMRIEEIDICEYVGVNTINLRTGEGLYIRPETLVVPVNVKIVKV